MKYILKNPLILKLKLKYKKDCYCTLVKQFCLYIQTFKIKINVKTIFEII